MSASLGVSLPTPENTDHTDNNEQRLPKEKTVSTAFPGALPFYTGTATVVPAKKTERSIQS